MATTPNSITAPELQGLRAQPADNSSLWSAVVGGISDAANEVKQVPGAVADYVADKIEHPETPTVAETIAHSPIPGADTLKNMAAQQPGLAGKLAAAAIPSTLEDAAMLAGGGEEGEAAEYAPEMKGLRAELVETPHTAPVPEIEVAGPHWDRTAQAKVSGEPAGQVGYKVDTNGRAQIYGAVVPEEYRGQGVGTHIYKNVVSDAKKNGAKTLTSDSTNTSPAANRVWQKLKEAGYPVEDIKHPNGKPGHQINLSQLDEMGRPKAAKGEKLHPDVAKIIADMPPNGGRAPIRSAAMSPEAAKLVADMPPNGRAPISQ